MNLKSLRLKISVPFRIKKKKKKGHAENSLQKSPGSCEGWKADIYLLYDDNYNSTGHL